VNETGNGELLLFQEEPRTTFRMKNRKPETENVKLIN